ncbi:unnamed protein product, partial [Oppiella nova]
MWPEFGYILKGIHTVKELQVLMGDAEKHNVFIIQSNIEDSPGFIHDEKVQAYIDKALLPMVNGLKGKKALAAWNIQNEPEENLIVVLIAYLSCGSDAYLQVKGKEFYYNGQK